MKQLLNAVAIAVVLVVAAPVSAQMPMTPGGAHNSPTQAKTTTAPTAEPTTQPNITFPATPDSAGQDKGVVRHRG